MYLKSIEIQGFKSFANKIKFEFHDGITGIVGPNGSGKSNVADAVRWVLGEQKIKQLRGSKMEDVIFSGTEMRKPLGFAFVAITLDNSDKKLPIDYDEVTVSRRLFRSGESEYMINGTVCRLKDVHELFYDTGIGKEGYSIIGQGQIDKILSGKPEERRELFDEAAGIVKFKRRKNETLKKLNDEEQNLVRVEDILSELERQVKPLAIQSEKAKKYLTYRDELKNCETSLFVIDMDKLKADIEEIEKNEKITQNDYNETESLLEKTKLEYSKLDAMLEKINDEIEEKKDFVNESILSKEKLENQILLINEQINSAKASDEHIKNQLDELNKSISDSKSELDAKREDKADIEANMKNVVKKQSEYISQETLILEEISEIEEKIDDAKAEIINLLNAKTQIKSSLERCDTLIEQINIRKNELEDKIAKFKEASSKQDEIINDLNNELIKINDSINDLSTERDTCEEKIKEAKNKQAVILKDIDSNKNELLRNSSRLESLKNITEKYEGYGNSIKKVMELKSSKKGIVGVVADIIKTEKKYEVAIETALGGNIQNIVTDTETTAKEIIEYLKKNKFGRATFLPLSSMSNNRINFNNVEALEMEGVLGLASSLVEIDEKYSGVAKFLLGRVVVVDNIDNAIALARRFKYTLRIVTLEGELLNAGGSISGGAYKNTSNLLGRRREIEELEGNIKKLKSNADVLDSNLVKNRSEISVISEELEKINKAIHEQFILQNTVKVNLNQADEKKKNIVSEFEEHSGESENIENEISDIKKDSEKLSDELINSEDRIKELENIVNTLTAELKSKNETKAENNQNVENVKIEIASLSQKHEFISSDIARIEEDIRVNEEKKTEISRSNEENSGEIEERLLTIDTIKNEIEKLVKLKDATEKEIDELQNSKDEQMKEHKDFFDKREEYSEKLSVLDREIFRLSAQKEKLCEKSDNKVDYMWTEYELTYGEAKKNVVDLGVSRSELGSRISGLKKDIKDLGPVNVNAIEEYKEVGERYEFMNAQHEDLMKAKENLLSIIDELDKGMKKQFTEKFNDIRNEFDKVYKELFGGGKGTIELDESEDILEAGVQIISQPPGKQLKNMMQLSGGEKAFTAIALLFAIQNLKPSPFCLLDEIEAALDGSNVVKFAQYLHKLTEHTQFIVITHRRGTMESVDRLYGITMQEKGISTLVSVDLIEGELAKEEQESQNENN